VIGNRQSQLVALGFLGGAACGALAWTHFRRQFRHALFSRSPMRRFAALSYLRSRPSVDTVRILREYIAWEKIPMLRHQGLSLLRRAEASLT